MIDIQTARLRSRPGRRYTLRLLPAACMATAVAATAARAQTPPSAAVPAEAAASAVPQEAGDAQPLAVTITATRRREPAREVPMQVNLLPTEQLDKAGAKTLTDYMAGQPGIDVSGSTVGLSSVAIRGVTTGAQTISTVGTYIDDVAFGSSTAFARGAQAALDISLLDLDHIEVLRGPQGTLYGAGAMGGLLKYVTVEPDTYAFGGKVSFGASATEHGGLSSTVSTTLNVPLKEDVAGLRVSAYRDRDGGYVDAIGPAGGKDVNSGGTTGARVSLLLLPTDRLRVRLSAIGQDLKRGGPGVVDYSMATGAPVAGDWQHSLSLREPYEVKLGLGSADIEYDFGAARLNSITSVQTSSQAIELDYSGVYAPLLQKLGVQTVPVSFAIDVHKVSQELRLTSKTADKFEWIAGLFYTHESSTQNQLVTSTLSNAAAGPVLLQASMPADYTEYAAYGDITWKPLPRTSITAGMRIARNKQGFGEDLTGALSGGDANLTGHSGETSKTYMLTAGYALTPVSNVYTRIASGYRPGGPNPVVYDPATQTPLSSPSFHSDSLWSYEVGYKADLLGRRLSLESSLYDIEWKDLQQFTAVNGLGVIVNGGKARVQGAELSLVYRPAHDLDLTFGGNVINARLSQDAPGLGANGDRLPNTAREAASIGATYRFPVDSKPAYAGIGQRFVGRRNSGFDGSVASPNYALPSYSMTDLQAGIKLGAFDIAFYARNVFNKEAQLSANTNFVSLGGPVYVTPARPRTIGLNATVNF